MSDKAQEYTVPVIPNDAVVNIPISGAFHGRIQRLYFSHMARFDDPKKMEEKIKKATSLKEFSEADASAFDLQTILKLMYVIDSAFTEGKLTVDHKFTVDPDNPPKDILSKV